MFTYKMLKTMIKKEFYVDPQIEVVHTAFDHQLLSTSFPNNGGHNDGGDDGQDLNAKQGFFDEEDEEIANNLPGFGSIW